MSPGRPFWKLSHLALFARQVALTRASFVISLHTPCVGMYRRVASQYRNFGSFGLAVFRALRTARSVH